MRILPPSTSPPGHRVERRHSPKPATGKHGYRDYRACLRWDFGFSCAFCLLHETDLAQMGAEGLGVTGVEHYVPKSIDPGLKNDYGNCFYACRLCNSARSDLPASTAGGRLLNPCADVWSEHFEVRDDRIRPRQGDADAMRTRDAYDLNDERKVRLRTLRRKTVEVCRSLIVNIGMVEALNERSSKARDPLILDAARELWQCVELASQDLERYLAVPEDAPEFCRCDSDDNHSLPQWLNAQTSEISRVEEP